MKHITRTSYYFGLLLILLFACTKDIDIRDQFSFKIETNIFQEGFVYESTPLTIKVVPERIVNGTVYKLSYQIVEGKYTIETEKPTILIKEGEEYILPSTLKQDFKYIPTEVGINKIIITVEDNHGNKRTEEHIELKVKS